MTTTTERPDLPLPAGATPDLWQSDGTRLCSREVGTLIVSADPLRNPTVWAYAEQRRDGRIGAVEVDIEVDGCQPLSADQARELAALLIEAADQVEGWIAAQDIAECTRCDDRGRIRQGSFPDGTPAYRAAVCQHANEVEAVAR